MEVGLVRQAHSHGAPTARSQSPYDAQRDRLVSNVVGHLSQGVSEPVLERAPPLHRNAVLGGLIHATRCMTWSDELSAPTAVVDRVFGHHKTGATRY